MTDRTRATSRARRIAGDESVPPPRHERRPVEDLITEPHLDDSPTIPI